MSYQFGESRVDDDLTLLSETLEEVKNRVSHASDSYYYRAKQAVYKADDYVHEKPWQGIGVGAAVGLVLGLLLARR
ncbi:DUF883 family protein [Salmonella enterica]|nr:DUF883 family protein [Salmonella enterica]EIY3487115.1 DUF883 family protein [Salmonella enterica]EKP5923623.1 DUF883 family protein [Salmonella enterica]EKP8458018.1 DUF883 family protein [Salmonella enterica]ELH8844429.1 DUF883 family protein [Salmonella enterica]